MNNTPEQRRIEALERDLMEVKEILIKNPRLVMADARRRLIKEQIKALKNAKQGTEQELCRS
jgi:hypothetical protein